MHFFLLLFLSLQVHSVEFILTPKNQPLPACCRNALKFQQLDPLYYLLDVKVGTWIPRQVLMILDTRCNEVVIYNTTNCRSDFHICSSPSLINTPLDDSFNNVEFGDQVKFSTSMKLSERCMEENKPGSGRLALGFKSSMLTDLNTSYPGHESFALFLTGDVSGWDSRSSQQPSISFGSIDLDKYSGRGNTFSYVTVFDDWSFTVGAIYFGDDVNMTPIPAIIRSDVLYIGVPSSLYDSITSKIDFACGYKKPFPCLTLEVDGTNFTIGEKQLIIDDSTCAHRFKSTTDNTLVLGIPFLQSVYVHFDRKRSRIGLAVSANVKTSEELRSYTWVEIMVAVLLAIVGTIGFCWIVVRCYLKKQAEQHERELLRKILG